MDASTTINNLKLLKLLSVCYKKLLYKKIIYEKYI